MKSPYRILSVLVTLLMYLFMFVVNVADAQDASPCAEGWSNGDPRHRWVICLPEVGRMSGIIPQCWLNRYEEFGEKVHALSDVNGDSLDDWLVLHHRCDTSAVGGRTPTELLLYKGVLGRLPDASSGERIGPTEIGSLTAIVASGDWDGDSHVDLAVRVQLLGDTSENNTEGYDIASLVVFWGNASGTYSLADTTWLACGGRRWFGPRLGIGSTDWDGDSVPDLLVYGTGAGFTEGRVVKMPEVYIYRGHRGERWGRSDVSRSADWQWWNAPDGSYVQTLDQDGDEATDLIFSTAVTAGTSAIVAVYGMPGGGWLDTASIESVDLLLANGHSSILADVTGDKIPELLVHAGSQEQVKVFIGLKGQRLKEQYGSGIDSARPGEEQWWGKPWANIWLPKRVSQYWPQSNWLALADISGEIDGDGDGIGDIWMYAQPYLIMYRGGETMDSLIDAMVDPRPQNFWQGLTNLGDIDGTKVATLAMATGNGIVYVKPSREVVKTGEYRRLPPGTGIATVETEPEHDGNRLSLAVVPNPARDEVRITWDVATLSGMAEIAVTDLLGRELRRWDVPAVDGNAVWNASGAPSGAYFITLRISTRTAIAQVVLE